MSRQQPVIIKVGRHQVHLWTSNAIAHRLGAGLHRVRYHLAKEEPVGVVRGVALYDEWTVNRLAGRLRELDRERKPESKARSSDAEPGPVPASATPAMSAAG